MASRPVFIPNFDSGSLVIEKMFDFDWHSGFAVIQKRKSIESLHQSALNQGITPVLEISTKSNSPLGQKLSAFNLSIKIPTSSQIIVEAAFQGSKVFENGGPHHRFYNMSGREIKRELRELRLGRLMGFLFNDESWPMEPKTAFYDWIYLTALNQHKDLSDTLLDYKGFTDIEFNPKKSLNCQARSAALFVTLQKRGLLNESLSSQENFIRILGLGQDGVNPIQGQLL